ncbi:hypothetical protein PTKIN_Ptkin15bG0048700 [Pterospermum kingtungense]
MAKNYVLEITLISAQGLKEPSSKFCRMETYAVAWTDSSVKLRTCVDHEGGGNPTWNDKFLFKVSSEFLFRETSGISIEIFAVGVFRDELLGTVRFLVSNFLPSGSACRALKTPSCSAVQVRRSSGRFHGILNIGATVFAAADVPAMAAVSAIGFRDMIKLMSLPPRRIKKSKSIVGAGGFDDGPSDGCESRNSSSTEGRKHHVRSSSEGGGFLKGSMSLRRKAAFLSPLTSSPSFNEGKMVKGRSRLA